MAKRRWTADEQAYLLEQVLPVDMEGRIHARARQVAKWLDRGAQDRKLVTVGLRDTNTILRYLWGLSLRAVEYQGGQPRTSRAGLPWTWCERTMLAWAFHTHPLPGLCDGKPKPDAQHMAAVLGRTEAEVLDWLQQNPSPHTGGFKRGGGFHNLQGANNGMAAD